MPKPRRAKRLEFHEVIDVSVESLGDGVRCITAGYGADIVIDGIGGDVLSEALGVLALGGTPTHFPSSTTPPDTDEFRPGPPSYT
jgi:NADPH2:quinone reductase